MSVLRNSKHERFAQALARGLSQFEAHGEAGFKAHRGNASKLAQDKSIVERVAELALEREQVDRRALAIAVEKLAITKENVLAELAKIGFANMADYMRGGADGDPYLDFSNLTRDQAAALQEVTVEDFKDGRGEDARDVRRIKFKLHDKKGALVDLGRHLGLFPNKVELGGKDGGPIELKDVSDSRKTLERKLDRLIAPVGAIEVPSKLN